MTTRREMILSTLAADVCRARGNNGDDAASRAEAHADTMSRQHRDWMGHETIAMLL